MTILSGVPLAVIADCGHFLTLGCTHSSEKAQGAHHLLTFNLLISGLQNARPRAKRPLQRSMPLMKILLAVLTIMALGCNLSAKERSALKLEGFSIGCDLRKFKSRYKHQLKCIRTFYPLIETKNKRETWNRTLNCSLESGLPVDGRPVPGKSDNKYVAGLNAVFEGKKLAMLECFFEGSEFQPLKNSFTAQFGPPATQQFNDSKDLVYTEWLGKDSKIEVQLIPLRGRLTESGVIQVDKKSNHIVVSVRLTALDAPKN